MKKHTLTLEAAAYDLNVEKNIIQEYMSLAEYSLKFPTLPKIHSKRSALNLIQKFGNNADALRANIKLATIQDKTRLEMTEIKNAFLKNKKEEE